MPTQFQRAYGLTFNFFAFRKPNSESVIIGGDGENSARWTRVLTGRAAKILWYQLGLTLFPARFETISPKFHTVPYRSSSQPSITSELQLEKLPSGFIEITGSNGELHWCAQFDVTHGERLWDELDIILGEDAEQANDDNIDTVISLD